MPVKKKLRDDIVHPSPRSRLSAGCGLLLYATAGTELLSVFFFSITASDCTGFFFVFFIYTSRQNIIVALHATWERRGGHKTRFVRGETGTWNRMETVLIYRIDGAKCVD